LKKSFIKKRFHKLLLEHEQNRLVSNEEVYTVAILTSAELSKFIHIQDEAERILDIGNMRTYRYRSFSKNQVRSYKYYTEKDFNWKGEPKKGPFKDFLEEPFDLLIGYFNKNNLYLENAVLRSKAKFKVGFAKVNQGLYDLEIAESPNKVESFLSELKKYLLVLQKLKN
jgi:hypothetical protein